MANNKKTSANHAATKSSQPSLDFLFSFSYFYAKKYGFGGDFFGLIALPGGFPLWQLQLQAKAVMNFYSQKCNVNLGYGFSNPMSHQSCKMFIIINSKHNSSGVACCNNNNTKTLCTKEVCICVATVTALNTRDQSWSLEIWEVT